MKYVIFGANSDIAFELSKILIKNNCEILLASRNSKELKNKEIFLNEKSNKPVKSYCVDIQKNQDLNKFLDYLKKDIYHLIICSGYMEVPEINHKKIMDINFEGPKNLIEKIINNSEVNINKISCITSVASDRQDYRKKSYSLAKRRLSEFLKLKSENLKTEGIIIQNIKPGYVYTKMTRDIKLPKILVINSKTAAKKIFKNLNTNNKNIYIPFFWKYILVLYNLLFKIKVLK